MLGQTGRLAILGLQGKSAPLVTRLALSCLVAGLGLAASSPRDSYAADAAIQVQVWILPTEADRYELQLGNEGWKIHREGEATANSDVALPVILWRTRDCSVMARFIAAPTSVHFIRILHGQITVQHNHLEEPTSFSDPAGSPSCKLPETDIATAAEASPPIVWPSVFVLVFLISLLVTTRRRLSPAAVVRR